MQALGLGDVCVAVAVQRPIPRGRFTLYVFREVTGFAGPPGVWVNGISGEGRLYVQETRR